MGGKRPLHSFVEGLSRLFSKKVTEAVVLSMLSRLNILYTPKIITKIKHDITSDIHNLVVPHNINLDRSHIIFSMNRYQCLDNLDNLDDEGGP
jgi:hypothetical protein